MNYEKDNIKNSISICYIWMFGKWSCSSWEYFVIMTGWRSDVCVAQTAIEAFYRGFRVAVADDGVNSTTEAEHRQGMQLLAINYNFDFYPCETILENLLQQE